MRCPGEYWYRVALSDNTLDPTDMSRKEKNSYENRTNKTDRTI
jgi:hypothetical protein